jgi:hypothetical protein
MAALVRMATTQVEHYDDRKRPNTMTSTAAYGRILLFTTVIRRFHSSRITAVYRRVVNDHKRPSIYSLRSFATVYDTAIYGRNTAAMETANYGSLRPFTVVLI